MFANSGLSLEQAPPIKVVLRFFITGSFFGVTFAIMLIVFGLDVFSYQDSIALVTVHTLAIGTITSFMLGALFQMLPVLCGVHIKVAEIFSMRVNYALIMGLISLILAFNGSKIFMLAATVLFLYAFINSAIRIFIKLKSANHNATSRGMMLSIISLFVLTVIGILLLNARFGLSLPFDYLNLKMAHIGFALFGWISLLIISVSFQVIEMFYVTKAFNKLYTKALPISIFSLLTLNLILLLANINISYIIYIAITILISLHFLLVAKMLYNRKRKIKDATVWFWYLSSISFLLFSVAIHFNLSYSAIFFTFFATSVVISMSYKITPFLVWFHLSSKGYFEAPMMHEVIHPKYTRFNFSLHLLSFFFFSLSPYTWIFFYIGASFLLISFLTLFILMYSAFDKYNNIFHFGKKIELNFK